MRESQAPIPDSESRSGLWGYLLDLGRRAYARWFGRKSTKNPNIYPLY